MAFEAEAEATQLARETNDVARWLNKNAIPRIEKATWLGHPRSPWQQQIGNSDKPGALPVQSAQGSLTRDAHQRRWARSRAMRRGHVGLAKAISAPAEKLGPFYILTA